MKKVLDFAFLAIIAGVILMVVAVSINATPGNEAISFFLGLPGALSLLTGILILVFAADESSRE